MFSPAAIKCFLFADDAKVYDKVKTIADSLHIQLLLNAIFICSSLWQLPINILGLGNINFSYHINDIHLSSEDTVSDLGITISHNLTYHEHINKILVKSLYYKKFLDYKNQDMN